MFNIFYNCTSLTSVNIPSSVTSIGPEAFASCSALVSIIIPNSVKNIERYAFSNCSSLVSVVIPKKVTRIYEGTFRFCDSLTSIIIPKSVTSIYTNAFQGCWKLNSVTTKNRTPISIGSDVFANPLKATLYVPTGSRTAYLAANNWRQFHNIVEFDLTHRLTYVVDGVEYKVCTIEEDAPITPEPEPTKEGYTFSGWIGLPETMPDHDVTVEGIFTLSAGVGQIIHDNNSDATIYTLGGNRTNHPRKGVNIIRYQDGSTKKTIVK